MFTNSARLEPRARIFVPAVFVGRNPRSVVPWESSRRGLRLRKGGLSLEPSRQRPVLPRGDRAVDRACDLGEARHEVGEFLEIEDC